jgi:O-antigen ligase
MLALICVAAAASALLGAAQLGSPRLYLFEYTQVGYAAGFFSSRNVNAAFLLIGLLTGAAWIRQNSAAPHPALLTGALILFFGTALIVTGSRAGLTLSIAALIGCALLAGPSGKTFFRAAGGLLAAGAVAIAVLYSNPVVLRTLDRFSELQDLRPEIWATSIGAAALYFPVGTGMGTFVPIYSAAERIEQLRSAYINRAHNDYLELLLEAGALGLAIMGAAMAIILWRGTSMIRSSRLQDRQHGLIVLTSFLIIALHSLVDYPLRTPTIGVTMAMLLGLLHRPPLNPRRAGLSPRPDRPSLPRQQLVHEGEAAADDNPAQPER